MSRPGLAAEVPTRDLCREMAAIPALAEAFKDVIYEWTHYDRADIWDRVASDPSLCRIKTVWTIRARINEDGEEEPPYGKAAEIPAPTVRELRGYLLEHWLSLRDEWMDSNDPDVLCRVCIKALKAGA